jgi:hypothetical protein
MKNNAIISRFLLLVLLATMVFQAKHSYLHLQEQLEAAVCHHENAYSDKQITHAHHYSEPCSVCAFTISSFLATPLLFLECIPKMEILQHQVLYCAPAVTFYSGCLLALRGPPLA